MQSIDSPKGEIALLVKRLYQFGFESYGKKEHSLYKWWLKPSNNRQKRSHKIFLHFDENKNIEIFISISKDQTSDIIIHHASQTWRSLRNLRSPQSLQSLRIRVTNWGLRRRQERQYDCKKSWGRPGLTILETCLVPLEIELHEPIWEQKPQLITTLIGFPLLIFHTPDDCALEFCDTNEKFRALAMDPKTGIVPEKWTKTETAVEVVRADRGPFPVDKLQMTMDYCELARTEFQQGKVPIINKETYDDFCEQWEENKRNAIPPKPRLRDHLRALAHPLDTFNSFMP